MIRVVYNYNGYSVYLEHEDVEEIHNAIKRVADAVMDVKEIEEEHGYVSNVSVEEKTSPKKPEENGGYALTDE